MAALEIFTVALIALKAHQKSSLTMTLFHRCYILLVFFIRTGLDVSCVVSEIQAHIWFCFKHVLARHHTDANNIYESVA